MNALGTDTYVMDKSVAFRNWFNKTLKDMKISLNNQLKYYTIKFNDAHAVQLPTSVCIYIIYSIVAPHIVTTRVSKVTTKQRVVAFSNQSTYTPYCSELHSRAVIVKCRAIGIPQPTVDIFGNNTAGNLNITEVYRVIDEVQIRLRSIPFGDVVMLTCQASNVMMKTDIKISLHYSCTYV